MPPSQPPFPPCQSDHCQNFDYGHFPLVFTVSSPNCNPKHYFGFAWALKNTHISLKHFLIHTFSPLSPLFLFLFVYHALIGDVGPTAYLQFPAVCILLVASPKQSLVWFSSLCVAIYTCSRYFCCCFSARQLHE